MVQYKLVSQENRAKYAPELAGSGHILVEDGEKFWVVKHTPGLVDIEKRELLGYLLGHRFANVAEVRLLDGENELRQIRSLSSRGEESNSSNTFLIRLARSYTVDELPCKTPDQAVARELVYSTWIRRRDTHADNRVYVEGVPIFFDHHVAFLAEPHNAEIANFFNLQPPDYGHAGAWRVRERKERITTLEARAGNKTYHYVDSLDGFKKEVGAARLGLVSVLPKQWEDLIAKVGFTDPKRGETVDFLKRNLEAIDNDLKIMEGVIFRE